MEAEQTKMDAMWTGVPEKDTVISIVINLRNYCKNDERHCLTVESLNFYLKKINDPKIGLK